MLSVIMRLNKMALATVILSVIKLSVIMTLSSTALETVMLNVVMLSVIVLNVVMPSNT